MARVLICDDDGDLAELIGDLFEEEGVATCVVTTSLEDVKKSRREALACDLAILDVNLGNGRPSGVDVYRWLTGERFAGRVVFLTGHAKGSPLLAEAQTSGLPVLSKPIAAADLIRLASQYVEVKS